MAHSRFSIPLFAVVLLAIAACMAYLVVTKNLFGFSSFNNAETAEGPLYEDGSVVGAENGKNSDYPFFDSNKIKRAITSGAKKITGTQQVGEAEGSDVGVANGGGAATEVSETDKATTTSNSIIVVGPAQSTMSQRDYELRSLWKKYSKTIPRLYAHPRDENTEAVLGRVGQLSMESELGDKRQSDSELIKIAAAGEREGARALSFQYAKNNTVESLAWAMITNAVAENDYYLYVCTEEFTSCTESLFAQAEVKAKTYIGTYNFARVQ